MSSRRKATTQAEETVQRPRITPVRLLVATALGLAFLVRVAALWFPFVDDDTAQIQLNPHVHSWDFLSRYFTADVWSQTGCGSNYYRPIFLLWLRLNHSVFGISPMGWHVTALLLHVAVTYLVYLLATRLLNDPIAAGFTALIFAVHPITVESTAFISGATEALEGVFFVGCLLCYLKGRPQPEGLRPSAIGRRPEASPGKAWRLAALGLFALALLAKETAAVIPLLLFISETRFQGFKVSKFRSPGASRPANVRRGTGDGGRGTLVTILRPLAPYLIVLVVYLMVRALALQGIAPGMKHVSALTAFATWPAVLWFYVHKLIAPWPLSLDYGLQFTSHIGLRNFALPILALLAIAAGLWTWTRRDRRVGMACAWFLIPLLPALGGVLRFDRGQIVHDRYLYLPLIGFAMLCAMGIRSLAGGERGDSAAPSETGNEERGTWNDLRLPQLAILLVMLLVWGITAVKDVGNWSDNMVVYRHALAVSPDNAYAHNSVAEQLFNHTHFDEAFAEFKQALSVDPQNTFSRTCLAQAYGYFGKWNDQAEQMRIVAGLVESSCAWANLADAQTKTGQLSEAEASWRHALALPHCPPHSHAGMAEVLRQEGKLTEAEAEERADQAEQVDDPE
jgi:hypothetical protein